MQEAISVIFTQYVGDLMNANKAREIRAKRLMKAGELNIAERTVIFWLKVRVYLAAYRGKSQIKVSDRYWPMFLSSIKVGGEFECSGFNVVASFVPGYWYIKW